MKIMYIITRTVWGGAQAHVSELVKHQQELGNEVVLVSGEDGELNRRASEMGVQFIKMNNLVRNLSPLKDMLAVFELSRIVREEKPDIVHLHSSKAGMIGRAAKVLFSKNVHVVFTIHGYGYRELSGFKRRMYVAIERVLYHFADALIFVSQYDIDSAKKIGALPAHTNSKKVFQIHNGVELAQNKERFESGDGYVVSMIARFDIPKRQDLLLKVATSPEFEDVSFVFVGDGPELGVLQQNFKDATNILFAGFQTHVHKFLIEADVLVLLSDFEALSISVLEAMSEGLPIIASNVGGMPELVADHVNGILVENTETSVSDAINYYRDADSRAVAGRASRDFVTNKFSVELMNKRITDVYSALMN